MKKLAFILFLITSVIVSEGCSRKSGCPTFDQKTGEYKVKSGGKTKSGLFPKKMK